MIRRTVLGAVGAFFLLGCNSETETAEPAAGNKPESPGQAIEEIIRYYETGDFEGLVRNRYAEIAKAENDAQIDKLIATFATRFAEQEKRDEAIRTYKTALESGAKLSEDGGVVTFQTGQGTIKLSRMPNGKWGFHL